MLRIGNYFRTKSIKLSDSYTCTVYNSASEPVECIQCIGFTAPKILQYNEEVYKYGNLAQKFLIPKLDVVHEFTIDFFESFDTRDVRAGVEGVTAVKGALSNSVATGLGIKNWILKNDFGKGFILDEKFDVGIGGTQTGQYLLGARSVDFPQIKIDIWKNDFTKTVYSYVFTNCRIAKVVPYEFDYQGEDLCKWTVTFVFDSMTKKGVK